MWLEYAKERLGNDYIEKKWGFVSYKIELPYLAIWDFYIKPDFRRKGCGTKLIREVEEIGRNKGCSFLWAQVLLGDPGRHVTLAALFKLKFEIIALRNDAIILTRKIEGDKNGG